MKKKKKKKVGKGFKAFALFTFLSSIILLGKIIYINILSNLLLGLVAGVILIIDIICFFLLLKSKHKKIGLIISTLFIIIFSLLTFYLSKTTSVFESLSLDYKTYNYSVVVLKDSDYENIKDIKNKKLGYYDEESEETTKSLNKINNKVKTENVKTNDIHNLRDDLINEELDAILIEQSYLEILNENVLDDNTAFKDKIKEIYSFTIKIKIADISKDLNVTKEPFSIYISGIDTYGEISSVSRSDVNMVVTVNPSTNQVLLTSIPRDYYVKLYNKSGYKDKITHAGLYGVETSIQTVEELLDVEINYYIKVNFSSVIDIVNAIDGVSVYSEYEFTSIDNFHYEQGYNNVNGEEALSFARERKSFAIGDRQRVKNQQALLNAIIDKCLSPSIIKNYSNLLDSAQKSFVTNMPMNRITSLIKMQLTNNYSWNIISNSLNGIDDSNYTYSAPNTKVYVMSPVDESVEYASELINKVEAGEILDKTTIEEEQKKITQIVNARSNEYTNNQTSNNTSSLYDEENEDESTNEETIETTKNELVAKLVKSSVEFTEGDEYVYHGITATYNNKDITKDSNLEISFRVKNEEFSDYRDLIYYISNLEHGNYVINYIVSYKGQSTTLNQYVTIKKLPTSNNSGTSSSGNNSGSNSENNNQNDNSSSENDNQTSDDNNTSDEITDNE